MPGYGFHFHPKSCCYLFGSVACQSVISSTVNSSGLHCFIWCALVLHSWWSTSWESVTVTYINISINVLTVTWSLEGWLMTKVISMYMKWSEMKDTQSCVTLCKPMACSLPSSSVHGVIQARILEWVAICFPRGFFQSKDQTCIAGEMLYSLRHQGWGQKPTFLTRLQQDADVPVISSNTVLYNKGSVCVSS